MNEFQLRDEAKFYFIPFILGSTPSSHRLSKKIFKKYGITSYILDKKRSLNASLDLSSRFFKLTLSQSDDIIIRQLIDVAEREPYTLPILIPCTEEYKLFAKRCEGRLEATFVLSNEEQALAASPLKIIPT